MLGYEPSDEEKVDDHKDPKEGRILVDEVGFEDVDDDADREQ